jgi:hypothetical protein
VTPLSLTVRVADPADAVTLEQLAELDSVQPLSGRVLLAEVEGRAVAALSVDDGSAAADPFVPSADAVSVLRMRAGQLRSRAGARGGRVATRRAAAA